MKCSNCSFNVNTAMHHSIEVNECPGCGNEILDPSTRQAIAALSKIKVIDGDENLNQQVLDVITNVLIQNFIIRLKPKQTRQPVSDNANALTKTSNSVQQDSEMVVDTPSTIVEVEDVNALEGDVETTTASEDAAVEMGETTYGNDLQGREPAKISPRENNPISRVG